MRHPDVHQHHVRRGPPAQGDRLQAVARLADHLDAGRPSAAAGRSPLAPGPGRRRPPPGSSAGPGPGGRSACTPNPSPSAPYSSAPPTRRTRSSRPTRPCPEPLTPRWRRVSGRGRCTAMSSSAADLRHVDRRDRGSRVLDDVGERLLDDPVAGERDGSVDASASAPVRTSATSSPAARTSSTSAARSSSPRVGGRVAVLGVLAEHPEHRAGLLERLAAGVGDDGRGTARRRPGRPGSRAPPPRPARRSATCCGPPRRAAHGRSAAAPR